MLVWPIHLVRNHQRSKEETWKLSFIHLLIKYAVEKFRFIAWQGWQGLEEWAQLLDSSEGVVICQIHSKNVRHGNRPQVCSTAQSHDWHLLRVLVCCQHIDIHMYFRWTCLISHVGSVPKLPPRVGRSAG